MATEDPATADGPSPLSSSSSSSSSSSGAPSPALSSTMLPTADDDGMTDGDRGDYGDAEGEPSSKDVGALPGVLSPHRAMPSFATRLDLKLPTIRRDAPRPGDDDGGPMSPGRSVPVLPTPRSMSVVLGAGGEYSLPTLRYEALELRTDALGRSWIVTGTVHSMVLYFLNNPAAELRDLYSFLLVHRLILDPKVLWAFILNLLFPPQAAADLSLKRNIVDFVIAWVDRCAAFDFFSRREKVAANPLWKGAHELMARLMKDKMTDFSKRIMDKIKEKSKDMPSSVQTVTDDDYRGIVWNLTQTLFPRSLEPGQFSFDDLSVKEVANCLYKTEFNLFKNIRVQEFVERTWIKKQSSSLIYVMTARFNYVAYWVGTQILSRDSVAGRRAAIEKFIQIANECMEMRNFNSAMEVLAGLCMSPISRLKRTWEALSDAVLAVFQGLEECMSPMRNYISYRQRVADLRRRGTMFMPYVGLYLKDLVFADENPSWSDEAHGVVNFEKLDLISQIITEVEWVQRRSIVVAEVPETIEQYLNNLHILDDKELYDLSLKLEPRRSS